MRKIKYIVNPVAGNGSGINIIPIIHDKMELAGLHYSISVSGYKGNVEELAIKAIREGYNEVVAVGGDGTILEAFNGIVNTNTVLGIVPSGTGNDFVKMLDIPKNIEKAIDKIIKGNTKKIDSGIVNNYHFLNVVGLGIDGEIVEKTDKVKKIFKGSAAYVYSTFSVLANYKCHRYTIEIDGKVIHKDAFLVAVGNGKYFGGGMMITPGAEIDNEMFQVVIINKMPKLKFTILFSKVFSGKHVEKKVVDIYYGKKIRISADRPLKINADGNIIGHGNCVLEIQGRHQKIII